MKTIKQGVNNRLGISARGSMPMESSARSRKAGRRPTTRFERWLLTGLLASLGNPRVTITTWDGWSVTGKQTRPASDAAGHHFTLKLHDPDALLKLVFDPLYQFGELYSSGALEVDGVAEGGLESSAANEAANTLAGLIEAIFVARRGRQHGISRLLHKLHPPRSNLHGQARANIHHHYDIGNDFYQLWLDPQLVYTCAYFPQPTATLEAAQQAKMDMICRKLRLRPGERVVEAGCGWGALARFMAREYGVRVHAYNISREQIAYARQRAQAEGLRDQVRFFEADYRAIRGEYDVFVSVGMLEHVGKVHYARLGRVIDQCLGASGRGFIHSIGTDIVTPLNPWIERRIFPGAYPPTLAESMAVLETANMSVLDVENLRLHYARTLEHWLARYEAASEQIESRFDAAFVRAWRLYLAGSLAAFRSGQLQLFQILFQRSGDNNVPWTRAALYAPPAQNGESNGEPACNVSTS